MSDEKTCAMCGVYAHTLGEINRVVLSVSPSTSEEPYIVGRVRMIADSLTAQHVARKTAESELDRLLRQCEDLETALEQVRAERDGALEAASLLTDQRDAAVEELERHAGSSSSSVLAVNMRAILKATDRESPEQAAHRVMKELEQARREAADALEYTARLEEDFSESRAAAGAVDTDSLNDAVKRVVKERKQETMRRVRAEAILSEVEEMVKPAKDQTVLTAIAFALFHLGAGPEDSLVAKAQNSERRRIEDVSKAREERDRLIRAGHDALAVEGVIREIQAARESIAQEVQR